MLPVSVGRSYVLGAYSSFNAANYAATVEKSWSTHFLPHLEEVSLDAEVPTEKVLWHMGQVKD